MRQLRNFFSTARRSRRRPYSSKRSCIYSNSRRPQSHKSWLNSSSYPRDTRILPVKGQGESLLEQLRFWISIAMRLYVLENDAICRLLINDEKRMAYKRPLYKRSFWNELIVLQKSWIDQNPPRTCCKNRCNFSTRVSS